MFAVLQIKKCDQGILAVMKNRLLRPEINVDRVNIPNAKPFFVITTTTKNGQIPWKEIEYSLGRLSNRLLLPKDIIPPEDSGVKEINITDELPAKMLINTAIMIIKHSKLPSQRQRVTVVDRTGIYLKHIEKLVKKASVVRVITDKINQYEQLAQEIFHKWGASISVSSNLRFALQSDIIVSPFEQITSTNALVLSTGMCKYATAKTAICPRITLPKEFLEYLPHTIDEHDFACALYDSCELKKLADLSYETMLICGQEQSIYQLAKMIEYETV